MTRLAALCLVAIALAGCAAYSLVKTGSHEIDGVYTVGKSGRAKFHRVNPPNQAELRTLLNRVIQRVVRRLEREGLLIRDPEQPWLNLDFHEPMDSLSAASTGAPDRGA